MAANRLGNYDKTIQVIRRSLEMPDPGKAEPRHAFAVVLTTRASVKSKTGSNAFAQVVIDGKQITHVFEIRYTTIVFDTRDRVRDVRGNMYRIAQVDNVNLANRQLRIYATEVGNENVEAAL